MDLTFTAAQLAQLISTEALPPESARLRIKNFVAKGYIFNREREKRRSDSDGRGTLLFSVGDALTAAVLSRMVDLGGLSKDAMQAAAARLQGWTKGDGVSLDSPETPESPAQWMWNEFAAAPETPPGFTLHVNWQQKPTGRVNCRASLSHGDNGDVGAGMTLAKDSVPLASLLVAVDPIFPDLAARIARMKAN